MTAELYAIPRLNLRDVPARLRGLADKIEAGGYGQVNAAVVVLESDGREIHALGFADADAVYAMGLLGMAQRKIAG